LDAIDAMAQDIIECSLAHCAARSRSTAIASNSGCSSITALARTWLATASRDFGSVSVRHPLGRGSKASGIFEINVDRSKRKKDAWTTLVQRLARCEGLPVTAGNIDATACGMNASWEDA
jgi:hypothetical protein